MPSSDSAGPDTGGTVEVPLPAGDVTAGLVRIGATVRRPRGPHSDTVAAYLAHLAAAGFEGAPHWHGVDAQGRDILDYLEGDVPSAPPEPWATTGAVLAGVGLLLARLHAASAGFVAPADAVWFRDAVPVTMPADVPPPDQPDIVTHADITPQNTVFRDGLPWGLIDFDLTGPTTRLLDAINTAMHWVPLKDPRDREPVYAGIDAAARLRVFTDAYGVPAADRERLVDVAADAALRSWHRMRANAEIRGGGWARMWRAGVGDRILRRRAWLLAERDTLTAALLDGGPAGPGCDNRRRAPST